MTGQHEQALSETLAVIFIGILVIIATVLLIGSLTGVITNMLQKPALLSVQANQFDTTEGAHIISLFHEQGDPVILNGTSQKKGVSIISFYLTKPDGTEFAVKNSKTLQESAWRPGDLLYIYQKDSRYWFSDIAPSGASSLAPGTWTVKILDEKVKVLLHSLSVTIK